MVTETRPKNFNSEILVLIKNGKCPFCNRNGFLFTASHIIQKHGMTTSELREEFGFNLHTPLCTSDYSDICRSRVRKDNGKMLRILADGRKVTVQRRPKNFRPEGRGNHLDWLLSDRKKKIFEIVMSKPEVKDAVRKAARNRSPEIIKRQTERVIEGHKRWRERHGNRNETSCTSASSASKTG